MAARGHTRITIGADDVDVPALAYDAGGARGTCCDAIRVHGAGSVFALLDGQAVGSTPTKHQFYAAGDGLGLKVRTIRGTGGDVATASTALDIDLYWSCEDD
jgi:hypothetical protein